MVMITIMTKILIATMIKSIMKLEINGDYNVYANFVSFHICLSKNNNYDDDNDDVDDKMIMMMIKMILMLITKMIII